MESPQIIAKLREFIEKRQQASYEVSENRNLLDPVLKEERAILDTYDLITGQIDEIEKQIAAKTKPQEHQNPVLMVCDKCGMPNVTRGARADWDVNRQAWSIDDLLDNISSNNWCNDCEDSTTIKAIPLAKGFTGKI